MSGGGAPRRLRRRDRPAQCPARVILLSVTSVMAGGNATLAERLSSVDPRATDTSGQTDAAIAFWEARVREHPQAVTDRVSSGRLTYAVRERPGTLEGTVGLRRCFARPCVSRRRTCSRPHSWRAF